MNEPPTTANRRATRSKALHIALAFVIVLYLCAYAASTIWTIGYQGAYYWFGIGSKAFGGVVVPDEDLSYELGFRNSGWMCFPNNPPVVFSPMVGKVYTTSDYRNPRYFRIPFWIPLIPLLSFAVLLIIFRDRRRRSPGLCPKCYYNLTGNTSGRCPECGAPVPRAATPQSSP